MENGYSHAIDKWSYLQETWVLLDLYVTQGLAQKIAREYGLRNPMEAYRVRPATEEERQREIVAR